MSCHCCNQRPPKRRTAALLAIVGILVLAVAIYISVAFEAQLHRVNWATVTGVCMVSLMAYLFWHWARDPDNTVEPFDMILDPVTRRVSLWRVMIVIAFAIGIWTMAQWVITSKVPTDADKIIYLYGTILGSLIAKVASGEWADVKANRQPVPADPPTGAS